MSEVSPPRQNVPVFNPKYFVFLGAQIGGEYLDANYLKFPVSQYARQTFNSGIYLANSSNITFTDGTTQDTAATSSATPNIADVLTAGNDATGLEIDNFVANGGTCLTTPTPNSNDLQIATTAYTDVALTNYSTSASIAGIYETIANAAATYFTIASSALLAPLASPIFTGTPTTTTALLGDNSAQIANTAWVQSELGTLPPVPSIPFGFTTSNQSATQYGTSGAGYIAGQKFTFGGTWAETDYILIHIINAMTWNGPSQTSRGYTSGVLQIKPYWMPSGTWSGLSAGTNIRWAQNAGDGGSGTYVGQNSVCWYEADQNGGSYDLFRIYGNNQSIQFLVQSPGTPNGFTGQFAVQYLLRTTNGGTVSITLGNDGTSSYLNNSLP